MQASVPQQPWMIAVFTGGSEAPARAGRSMQEEVESCTCVGLRQEHAGDADGVPRLAGAGEAPLQVHHDAAGGGPLGHLGVASQCEWWQDWAS